MVEVEVDMLTQIKTPKIMLPVVEVAVVVPDYQPEQVVVVEDLLVREMMEVVEMTELKIMVDPVEVVDLVDLVLVDPVEEEETRMILLLVEEQAVEM